MRKHLHRTIRSVVVIAGLLTILALAPSLAQGGQPPEPPTGFVPAASVPREQLSAVPLVIAAYAVAWVLVFGYLWSIWSRLGRVERELANVTRRVEAGALR